MEMKKKMEMKTKIKLKSSTTNQYTDSMKNKNTAEANYYSAFVDSILSLPVKTRKFLLEGAAFFDRNGNAYDYLWNLYCNDNEMIHGLLDKHKLAID